jgi:uncharacterized phage protein gp47/JayE
MSGIYVTPTGLIRPTLPEIKQRIEANLKAAFGDGIDLSPSGPFGQFVGLLANNETNLWELAEEIYTSRNPGEATGYSLDFIADETGVVRLAAAPTRVEKVMLQGDVGVLIPTGSLIRRAGDTLTFASQESVLLSLSEELCFAQLTIPTPFLTGLTYSVILNGTNYSYLAALGDTPHTVWLALFSQIAATSNGNFLGVITGDASQTATLVSSGAADWLPFVLSVTNLTVDQLGAFGIFSASETGPIQVNANTLVEIVTPVAGWLSVNNPLPGQLGSLRESDDELRIRRAKTFLLGNATEENIRAALLARVDNITSADVKSNRTMTTSIDGIPPKAFEAIIGGAVDSQQVGNVIWETMPAGIESYGNVTVNVLDSEGTSQTVKFTVPQEKYLHLRILRSLYSEEVYPVNGDQAIKDAVLAWALTEYTVGQDVIPQRVFVPIYTVPGIAQVSVEVSVTPAPGDAPTWTTSIVPVDARDYVALADSRIFVGDL